MYTSHFGLSEKPFAITPDPRYLYLSARHAEALAHLLYGINEGGGFVQLTGEVGTGKTTVVRTLLSRIPPHADVAVILNPRVTAAEFLLSICEELGVATAERGSIKHLVDALNRRLLAAHAAGRRVILIVDEAQNLSPEVLEHVRLLTNLETPTQKLLQILLIGQPELRDLLDRTELRQLAQRVTGRYHLNPLSREETRNYVRHRLRVAGGAAEIFTAGALNEVHRLSGGIPRVINVCCDRALLGAYTRDARKVTAALVRRAAGEVYGRRIAPPWIGWIAAAAAMLGIAGVLFAGWQLWSSDAPPAHPAAAMRAAPPAPPARAGGPVAASRVAQEAALHPASAAGTILRAADAAPTGATSAADSIYAWLDALPPDDGGRDAYRRLLGLWGVPLAAGRDPCEQAAQAGLDCLDQRGSWAEVRVLNRPAVLQLTDDQGRMHHVLLTALSGRAATLAAGGARRTLSIDDLSKAWFGDFTLIWKPKTGQVRELAEGMRGNEVRWLRRSLAALSGTADDPAHADLYDHDLTLAVEAFQRAHQLNVDGIAGVQTQAVLDAALADPHSPLLRPVAKRGG